MGNSVSTQAGAPVASSGRSGGVVVENQPHPEPASAASVDDCPVLSGKGAANVPVQYNVYNQRIDPRNNMPLAANQAPFPGQKALLSTERIQSNIPKGGTESTWVYPSPQMFYNALKVRQPDQLGLTLVITLHSCTLLMVILPMVILLMVILSWIITLLDYDSLGL
jgi:hypothetical protein